MLSTAVPPQGVDSLPPFATGAQRLRLLYSLPLSRRESAILVLGSDTEADAVFDRAVLRLSIEPAVPDAVLAPAAFDVVALPGCLTGGANPWSSLASPDRVLQLAHSAVRPGGIVVGHLDHLLSAHRMCQALQGRNGIGSWVRFQALGSATLCLRTLVRAGFVAPQCFYVEPEISAPMALVPVNGRAARNHFLRAIRRTRGQYSMPGFLLRMALAGVGLGGTLQPHLFFWARRPC